jgi:hypothetical protein
MAAVMKVADRPPNALRSPPRERIMNYRTLGLSRVEDGDAPLDEDPRTGL